MVSYVCVCGMVGSVTFMGFMVLHFTFHIAAQVSFRDDWVNPLRHSSCFSCGMNLLVGIIGREGHKVSVLNL